jgi:hypothetical protein
VVGTQAFGQFQAEGGQDAFGFAIRSGYAGENQLAMVRRFQMDVAELNPSQFTQDDLRRHRSRLGGRRARLLILFVDQGHQAGTLGQVVERLPQSVRQHADEDMGLGAAGVVMPDGPQQEVAFQDAEGPLSVPIIIPPKITLLLR